MFTVTRVVILYAIGIVIQVSSRLALTVSAHVLRFIPVEPFLAMTPATTALGRSLTVAPILAGILGFVVVVANAYGGWMLLPAIVILMLVGIGCSRTFNTLWWPVALGGSLFLLAYAIAILPGLFPGFWVTSLEPGSPAALGLMLGGGAMFAAALWSTLVLQFAASDES
jgi:hypothetical protein